MHVVQFLGACMHPGCTMLITELMSANAQDLIHSGSSLGEKSERPLSFHPGSCLQAWPHVALVFLRCGCNIHSSQNQA